MGQSMDAIRKELNESTMNCEFVSKG